MIQSPFRFGLGPGGLHPTGGGAWAELARKAETLGYSTVSVSDHVMHYGPFSAMAVAAAATTTLRVGMLVACNDLRHPAELAREAATLDALSDGRLELGLGAGWMKADYDAISLGFDRPGRRIDRLREAVHVIRGLLSGGPCSFRGEFYTVDGLSLASVGPGSAQIPILLAGSGRRMLTLAAEVADIVGINVTLAGGEWTSDVWRTATADATDDKIRLIAAGSQHRDRAPERQIVSHFTRVTPDRRGTLQQMARTWGLAPDSAASSPHALIGSVEEIVAQIEQLRARAGISYITIDTGSMDEFAPVVARLAGH